MDNREIEKSLIKEYKANTDKYNRLGTVATRIIEDIISKNNLYVMEVSHRVKEINSLDEKIKRKNGKYRELTDITDLVGIRIVCYFSDAVDKITQILEEEFYIDKDNSIDKRATIQATEFGYLSVHYICQLTEANACDEDICGIPFEVQIRTVLQHAWAEIEHDLGYKSEFGIPRAIRRKFSQAASILEIADRQFVEIRDSSIEYTVAVREKICENQVDDVLLDRVSLKEYLHNNKYYIGLINNIKELYDIDVEFVDPEMPLKQLEWFGIKTLSGVDELIENNESELMNYLKELSDIYGIDIITSNIFIKYVCQSELKKRSYSDAQIESFKLINKG